MSTAMRKGLIEIIDVKELDSRQRKALDTMLYHRYSMTPDTTNIQLPQSINCAAIPKSAFAALAWSEEGSLSAAVIATTFHNSDPGSIAFEGKNPIVSSIAIFAPTPSIEDIPFLFRPVLAKHSAADRITLHVPLSDAVTSTALGHLGFTLDSFMALRAGCPPLSMDPPGGINIRVANIRDAEKIASLHVQHVKDQLMTSAFVSATALETNDGIEDVKSRICDDSSFHIAEHEGTIVGVIEFGHIDVPDDGKIRRTPQGRASVIQWICVASEYRGRGIGSALITSAINVFHNMESDYTYVFHGANNPLSTSRFWRRFGFYPTWGTWELNVK